MVVKNLIQNLLDVFLGKISEENLSIDVGLYDIVLKMFDENLKNIFCELCNYFFVATVYLVRIGSVFI